MNKVSACVKFLVSFLLSRNIDETRLGRREEQRKKRENNLHFVLNILL